MKLGLSLVLIGLILQVPLRAEVDLAPILAVGGEGAGNTAAAVAWEKLSAGGAEDALAALGAMDSAGPLASNYLRSGAEAAVSSAQGSGDGKLVAMLGEFLLDHGHGPRGRSLAYELLRKVSEEAATDLLPGLLHDPVPGLRIGAVAQLLDRADAAREGEDEERAALLYRQALGAAREVDQIKAAAVALEELGREVDLPRHFGFLMHWEVTAPFDNVGRAGFGVAYPPEDGGDPPAGWQEIATSDAFGMVDFNKPFGMLKEVVGYARTTFHAPTAGPAEIRLGCKNAWKIWLNGELLFARDEYHRGIKIDQYSLPVQLLAGENQILVKCCQNEQKEQWTVEWQFQMRVCDATGTAILSTGRRPTPQPEAPKRRPARKP